jgi:hypothetical protein
MGTGRNAFNMGRNAVIFLHPTLRNLTVSCFDIGEDIKAYLPANQNPTPLKSLTFDECNIAVAGLEAILSVPRALEKLTLGERMYLLRGNPHAQLGRSPAQFLQALALQKDSLQYLKHIGGRTDLPGSPTGLSMVTFPNMREMELDTYSILALVLSESAIPPNIHLRLIRSYILEQPSDVPEISPLPYILEWVRRVPQLEYVLDYDGREDEESILTDLWGDERNHKTWKKIFAVLGLRPTQPGDPTNKRSLRILVFKRSGFIPPYMYGEERPLEGVIFDSASHNARMVRLRDVAELLEDP